MSNMIIKIIIGLILLLPAMCVDIVLWVFGGWTKGNLFEMPCGTFVYKSLLNN